MLRIAMSQFDVHRAKCYLNWCTGTYAFAPYTWRRGRGSEGTCNHKRFFVHWDSLHILVNLQTQGQI